MTGSLRIEWMKLKNYRTFWILLAITVVSIPGFSYMFYNIIENKVPKMNGKGLLGNPFNFPDVWQTISWTAGGILFLIPAILIITLTTNEFTFKTHRQNIIDGWSRGQFIGVKLLQILILSVFTSLIVFLTALGFGHFGDAAPAGVSIWKGIGYVGGYFMQMLDYSLIAFLLATLIKRAGLAMGVFFIYLILEDIVVAVYRDKYHATWVNYLPEEVSDMLTPVPFGKGMLNRDPASWQHHVPGYLAITAAYILLMCFVVSWRYLKSDL